MIGIIDYGAGNLFSVKNTLNHLGVDCCIVSTKEDFSICNGLILPGVGAFPDAMEKLKASALIETIISEAKNKPLLGICLGMQILFETGWEFKETKGLGLIPGKVDLIKAEGLKIPHMGWNSIEINKESPLTNGLSSKDYVYFVHSYCAYTEDKYVCCYTDYGQKIPALVRNGNVYGAQFHPEKSSAIGLKILKNFAKLVEK